MKETSNNSKQSDNKCDNSNVFFFLHFNLKTFTCISDESVERMAKPDKQ